MTNQIKVGDVVKVVNKGQQYTTYDAWASRNSFKGFEINRRLIGNEQGVVEVIATHHASPDILCGINVDGKKHIIGIEGLEFVREGSNKPFDLQLFQRVELRNGERGIVVTNPLYPSNKALNLESGWVDIIFPEEGKDEFHIPYEIVKIFDLPQSVDVMVDFARKGSLLWEETKPQVIAADLAITEAENAVKAAQVALEAAQAARKAL
jgi:hypothetical protein